jgi:hypothetical protein
MVDLEIESLGNHTLMPGMNSVRSLGDQHKIGQFRICYFAVGAIDKNYLVVKMN